MRAPDLRNFAVARRPLSEPRRDMVSCKPDLDMSQAHYHTITTVSPITPDLGWLWRSLIWGGTGRTRSPQLSHKLCCGGTGDSRMNQDVSLWLYTMILTHVFPLWEMTMFFLTAYLITSDSLLFPTYSSFRNLRLVSCLFPCDLSSRLSVFPTVKDCEFSQKRWNLDELLFPLEAPS